MMHGTQAAKKIKPEPVHWPEDDVPTISPVIGAGEEAHRIVRVGAWEFVAAVGDDEPRIRDIDLAERLGYERAADIRDLVKRLLREGKLNGSEVFRTVRKTSLGGRPASEFWLTEAQALKVVAKSETAKADALLDEVIRVFVLARRGLLPQQQAQAFDIEAFVTRLAPLFSQAAANAATAAVAPFVARLEAVERRVQDGVSIRGTVSEAIASNIKARLRILGNKLVACGHEKKPRSARLKWEQRLRTAVRWTGRGCHWHLLPIYCEADALRELAAMEHEVNGISGALAQARQGAFQFVDDSKKPN